MSPLLIQKNNLLNNKKCKLLKSTKLIINLTKISKIVYIIHLRIYQENLLMHIILKKQYNILCGIVQYYDFILIFLDKN